LAAAGGHIPAGPEAIEGAAALAREQREFTIQEGRFALWVSRWIAASLRFSR
jgi:hypothetical protein